MLSCFEMKKSLISERTVPVSVNKCQIFGTHSYSFPIFGTHWYQFIVAYFVMSDLQEKARFTGGDAFKISQKRCEKNDS